MTVSDVTTAYELAQLETQLFGESSTHGTRLATLLGESLDSVTPHIAKSVSDNSLLRQYYLTMLGDLRRRLLAASHTAVVPTTALKRRRELIEPGAQTPLSNPPSSSAKKIKKYNAPRGSEYSPGSQTYKGGVKICGKHLTLPPTKDPELFVKWRTELLGLANLALAPDDKQNILEKAREYIGDLKTSLVVPISSASTEASTGPTSPVSGKNSSTILTPARIAAAASRKLSMTNSPKSAPHRVSLVPSDIDILRFRDKFYCRVSVFGEFISTGMRLSRTEAENDLDKLSRKLKSFSSYFRNPLVNQFKKTQVVEDVRAFAQTLDGTCAREPRVPQTEVKQKSNVVEITTNAVVGNQTLPRGVYKMRDKYYSSVVMFCQTFSTPMRDSIVEVVDDRAAFAEEIQKHKPDISGEEKNKVIEQVKQYLNERLMGDDFRTPKKSHN